MIIKHLWAPWRMEYIKGDRKTGCPFCELPLEEPSDQNLVLYRDESVFVIMNRFPYNPGHLLVIPRAHKASPVEIEAPEWQRLAVAQQLCLKVLNEWAEPQGFNMGLNLGAAGGAGIPQHLHWHLVPRWGGDTNFMPLIADTKAVPTHNATVYHQLKPHFANFGSDLDLAAPLKPATMKK